MHAAASVCSPSSIKSVCEQALRQSEKFIAAAEDFAARNKPVPAAANLRALAKRLEDPKGRNGDPYAALRQAVLDLEATFDD